MPNNPKDLENMHYDDAWGDFQEQIHSFKSRPNFGRVLLARETEENIKFVSFGEMVQKHNGLMVQPYILT